VTDSSTAAPKRRGVRLTPDEAWDMIEHSHTGILTTLRRDGVPIALPVWFVALDRKIYVSTPGASKKVARVGHDERASFLVESGERWVDLKAVHLTGRAILVDDPEVAERVRAASDTKYGAFRMVSESIPTATRKHYAQTPALICLEPDERIVSWENAKLFAD
jgi:nitroimidazol reductase NimA-like FMN-containing flavoprotein (pyridoxamine 5'-phosphate oxidase superfamily)